MTRTAALRTAPWLMKGLSAAGTAAMFLVGGGILMHGIEALEHPVEVVTEGATEISAALGAVTPLLLNAVTGLVAGAVALLAVTVAKRLLDKKS